MEANGLITGPVEAGPANDAHIPGVAENLKPRVTGRTEPNSEK
nr:unnamed protein product [Digitaria exilis]